MDEQNLDDIFGEDESFEVISLVGEDGEDIELVVLARLEDQNISYALVIESSEDEDEDMEAVIIKEIMDEENGPMYEVVEEDDEFLRVAALFKEIGFDFE